MLQVLRRIRRHQTVEVHDHQARGTSALSLYPPLINNGAVLSTPFRRLYAEVEAAGRAGKTSELPGLSQRLRPKHHAVCAPMQEELNRTAQSAA